MESRNHNRKYLKEIRQELRGNMMFSEARLWGCLKEKQLDGRKFRRQHSVNNYILDFYCPSEKLAIEVDGSSHDDIGSQQNDMDRDKKLMELGITVLRIPALDIRDNIDGVLQEIISMFRQQA